MFYFYFYLPFLLKQCLSLAGALNFVFTKLTTLFSIQMLSLELSFDFSPVEQECFKSPEAGGYREELKIFKQFSKSIETF